LTLKFLEDFESFGLDKEGKLMKKYRLRKKAKQKATKKDIDKLFD